MTTYHIQRVDVSYATVEAESAEEALEFADANPDIWAYEAGEPTVEEQ